MAELLLLWGLCMANAVTDPGFELGDPAWSFVSFGGTAERTSAYGARSGSWAGRVEGGAAGFGFVAQQLPAVSPLESTGYLVEGWARQLVPGTPLLLALTTVAAEAPRWLVLTDTDVRVYAGPLAGPFVLVDQAPRRPGAGWLRLQLYVWPAAGDLLGETGSVLVGVSQESGTIFPGVDYRAGGSWLVDDLEVTEMSLTSLLEADLLTDLGDISVANGFDTDVELVSGDPEDEQHAKLPALILEPDEGGESDPTELGNRAAVADQFWNLTMLVRGSRADLQDLLDDVRNAVARSTGNLMTRSEVEWAGLTSWTAPLFGVDQGTQRGKMTAQVRARYNYVRGGL